MTKQPYEKPAGLVRLAPLPPPFQHYMLDIPGRRVRSVHRQARQVFNGSFSHRTYPEKWLTPKPDGSFQLYILGQTRRLSFDTLYELAREHAKGSSNGN